MSAGHSQRRQNYTFVTLTPPAASHRSTPAIHHMRVLIAVVGAIALDLATFTTLSMIIAGR
jgi:hypothetical protein